MKTALAELIPQSAPGLTFHPQFVPAKPPKIKKVRAKRVRWFLVEKRVLPSTLDTWRGKYIEGWVTTDRFGTLAAARNICSLNALEHARSPGFFARGAEYRVRRVDTKVA